MEITADRWAYIEAYSAEVFGQQDEHLARLMEDAVRHGLPNIAVTAPVGRLLSIITALAGGRLAVELGTLAGYSGIWIARGLAPGGRLITVDIEPKHAAFAAAQFERAGVADKVEQRMGPAISVLPQLLDELGPGSVDLLFIDAVKVEYADYWRLGRDLVRPGGVVAADNVLAGGSWWMGDETDDVRNAIDAFNRTVAADDAFETVGVPMRQGVLVARRR